MVLGARLACRQRATKAVKSGNTSVVREGRKFTQAAVRKLAEAEQLHRESLEIRGRELGPEHELTLSGRTNLANVLLAQGRLL